jgi:hypothetical protein
MDGAVVVVGQAASANGRYQDLDIAAPMDRGKPPVPRREDPGMMPIPYRPSRIGNG